MTKLRVRYKNREPESTTRCDFCHAAVEPYNQNAESHICRTCLREFQVCDRVDNND